MSARLKWHSSAASQCSEERASSSRNAMISPWQAAAPALRAPEAPRAPVLAMTVQSVNSRRARASRPGLWSMTTIVSSTGAVCERTDWIASQS
jgi:hypothetical protein